MNRELSASNSLTRMFHENSNCYVKRLLVREVGNFHTQVLRPYHVQLTQNVVDSIENRIRPDIRFNGEALSGIVNDFISPSANPTQEIDIANGWMENRFLFMMEVVFESSVSETSEFILGYTDHADISILTNSQGLIDPDMVFYINSITTTVSTVTRNERGQRVKRKISGNKHILDKTKYGGRHRTSLYDMTPSKVIHDINVRNLIEESGNDNIYDGTKDILNSPRFSNRNNNSASRYVSRIIDTYKNVVVDDLNSLAPAPVSDLNNWTYDRLHEDSVSMDPFLSAMGMISQHGYSSSFTFDELMALDPRVDEVTQIIRTHDYIIDPMDANHMSGAGIETQIAVTLSNTIPAIMVEYGLVELSFASTNDVVGCQIETELTSAKSFTDNSIEQYINAIIDKIDNELIRNITMNNLFSYRLHVICNLIENTYVKIGIEGNPTIPYVIPTFADALFAPVVSNSISDFDNVSEGVSALTDLVDRVVHSSVPSNTVPDYDYSNIESNEVLRDMFRNDSNVSSVLERGI